MTARSDLILTDLTGLLAAVLVGVGEFMLHFDPLVRYGQGFDFLGLIIVPATLASVYPWRCSRTLVRLRFR